MKKYFVFLVISVFVSQAFAQEKFNHKEVSKTIFSLLQKNNFDSVETYFDTSFARRMTRERLEKLWKFVLEQGVAYVKTKEIKEDRQLTSLSVVQTIEFEKKLLDLKIIFGKGNKVTGLSFSPNHQVESYKLPAYYDSAKVEEKKVIITGGFSLPGSLTTPKSGGKFPAVVLVHGSGANDRDETVSSTKIFKDIALGLGMKGIAVLRYDKRSKVNYGKYMQKRSTLTVYDEIMDDVVSAVQSLKSNPAIDTNRIFLLGHGLGGTLLPRITKQLPDVAGLIIIGASARPLEDVIYERTSFLLSKDSLTDRKKALLDSMRIQVDKIKRLAATSSQDTTIRSLLGFPVSYWLDLNSYRQVEVAKKTNTPMYFLHGERDFQIPMSDFNLWKNGLAMNKNVQFKLYPKLNHLLQEGEGQSVLADYDKRANVPLYVIDDIANWIKQRKK